MKTANLLIPTMLLIISTSCTSPKQKETIVYQLDMANGDSVGHAVINALDKQFRQSTQYGWAPSSSRRFYTKLGIVTMHEPTGASIISVVIVGVNQQCEPLIIRQYSQAVPNEDEALHAGSLIFDDLSRALEESRSAD